MQPDTLEDVLTRIESCVETMTNDVRPSRVHACLKDVAAALRMLAAGNPSGVLTSTEE